VIKDEEEDGGVGSTAAAAAATAAEREPESESQPATAEAAAVGCGGDGGVFFFFFFFITRRRSVFGLCVSFSAALWVHRSGIWMCGIRTWGCQVIGHKSVRCISWSFFSPFPN